MKKILFGVAALGLLGLAGAGLGLKAQDAVEAKAVSDGFYLTGTWNDFSTSEGLLSCTVDPENANLQKYSGLHITAGSTFLKLIKITDGETAWYNTTSNPSYPTNTYINSWWVNEGTGYGNVGLYLDAGREAVYDVTFDSTNGNCSLNYTEMSLTIGDESVTLAKNTDSNDPEFYGTISSAQVGESVSIVSAGHELPLAVKEGEDNNLTNDKKVKAANGEVTIYYNGYSGATWLSGYSTNLHNFVSGFLADTISAGECADPTVATKEETNVWTFYKNWHADFADYETTAFQNAVTTVIGSGTYSGELQEAAKRYVHLLAKYENCADDPFTGVTVGGSAKIVFGLDEANKDVSIAPIALVAIAAAIGIGAFFIARKRRAE